MRMNHRVMAMKGYSAFPKAPAILETHPSDCLMSYQGHSFGDSYPSAEKPPKFFVHYNNDVCIDFLCMNDRIRVYHKYLNTCENCLHKIAEDIIYNISLNKFRALHIDGAINEIFI